MSFTGIGKLLKDFVINTLTTNDKTIPGAINELNSKTILINRNISDFNSAADGVTFFDTTSSIANNPSLATGGFLFQQSIRIGG